MTAIASTANYLFFSIDFFTKNWPDLFEDDIVLLLCSDDLFVQYEQVRLESLILIT